MRRSNSGLTAFFLVILGLGIFGTLLWLNAQNSSPLAPILPTEAQASEEAVSISQLLDNNFGSGSTPLPTIEIPNVQATRPIVVQELGASPTAISAAELSSNQQDVVNVGATPTLPPPTAIVAVPRGTTNPEDWAIPPLSPRSADPLGLDHYWFRRPIESNANNLPLSTYTYGAGGFFGSRIHHGIDIPNDQGQIVYAAASGTVIFASDARPEGEQLDIFQNTNAYGNVVFIRHDFGFDGQPLYTLYAHLQATLVTEGDIVQTGDPIALLGQTGQVTGPHVHFEVRIGGGDGLPGYRDTYNPILWMTPYIGHGVVAGRVIDANNELVDNVTVTLRNRVSGARGTTTYIFQDTVDDVNSDPNWNENFAFNDVPVGRYDIIVRINDEAIVRQIDVIEGITNFIELRPAEPRPTPTETETNGN